MTSANAREYDFAAIIARQKAQLEAQQCLIREQAAALAHSRKIFERASASARIGVWECDLADNALQWTDVVYDIFDFPRGSAIDRRRILQCYSAESLNLLEMKRGMAIEERGGFDLDVEITTAKGRNRWIRITATVECEDGVALRIFGMKQDITEEKLMSDRMRYLAEVDAMTGLPNRARFQAALSAVDARDTDALSSGALLLIDLDGFKLVNDTFGHALGDECLKEAAERLARMCPTAELVARIGGDEFAVLARGEANRDALEETARSIVDALSQPVKRDGHSLSFGASVGIAQVGACTASELFMQADIALYAAKAAGRNTYRMFSPAMMRPYAARLLPVSASHPTHVDELASRLAATA